MNPLHPAVTSYTHASSPQRGRAKNISIIFFLWLGTALSVSVFGVRSAHAVQVIIGGVKIADNGPNDLDPAQDAIAFDSTAPAPAGFALPAGSSVSTVSGQVVLVGTAGGLVQILGAQAQILTLTEFAATQLAGPPAPGNGKLNVSFDHTFQAPNVNNIMAADSIAGDFVNAQKGNVFQDTVTWQGFVNNAPITPPEFTVSTPAAAPGVPQMAVNGAHAPAPFAGGPPWTLKGELTVKLGALNNQLFLPNSAEVGISETDLPAPEAVKEFPFGIALVLAVIALFAVFAFLWWRRSSAA